MLDRLDYVLDFPHLTDKTWKIHLVGPLSRSGVHYDYLFWGVFEIIMHDL